MHGHIWTQGTPLRVPVFEGVGDPSEESAQRSLAGSWRASTRSAGALALVACLADDARLGLWVSRPFFQRAELRLASCENRPSTPQKSQATTFGGTRSVSTRWWALQSLISFFYDVKLPLLLRFQCSEVFFFFASMNQKVGASSVGQRMHCRRGNPGFFFELQVG